MFVSPDGTKRLHGHRAGGTVAYEGTPLAPSAAPTDYFVGVRDSKKIGKLTCSHALVMEMRSHLVDTSGDSNSALLADKMSYGESRSELIDSFGSRKVRHAACIVIVLYAYMCYCPASHADTHLFRSKLRVRRSSLPGWKEKTREHSTAL